MARVMLSLIITLICAICVRAQLDVLSVDISADPLTGIVSGVTDVTFTVAVNGQAGEAFPEGNVDVIDRQDASTLCSCVLTAISSARSECSCVAAPTIIPPAVEAFFSARFPGDATYNPSDSLSPVSV